MQYKLLSREVAYNYALLHSPPVWVIKIVHLHKTKQKEVLLRGKRFWQLNHICYYWHLEIYYLKMQITFCVPKNYLRKPRKVP